MFIPYKVDVVMPRWPIANWSLIAVTMAVSVALLPEYNAWAQLAIASAYVRGAGINMEMPPAEGILNLFLFQPYHFNPMQLIGCLFLHANIVHLLGNMFFLFLFGNAVNAKLGDLQYLALYFGIAIAGGIAELIINDGRPSLGASGAIMGIVGAFVMLYPVNDISVAYIWGIFARGVLEISSLWVVAVYVGFDVWGLVAHREQGVGYSAHVVGFAIGAATMGVLLWRRWVKSDANERNMLQLVGWLPETEPLQALRKTAPANRSRAGLSSADEAGWMHVPAPKKAEKPRDDSPIPLD